LKIFLIQKRKKIFSRNLHNSKIDDTLLHLSDSAIIDNHISINNEESQSDSSESSGNKNDFGNNKNDFGSNKNDKLGNVDTYNTIENYNINIDDNEDQGVSTNKLPPERTNSKETLQPLNSKEINVNVIDNDNDMRSIQETVLNKNENENIIENKLSHNDVHKNKTFTLYDTMSVINMKFNEVIGIIFR